MGRLVFLFFWRRLQGALLLLLLTAAAQLSLAALWHDGREAGEIPRIPPLEIPLGAQAALFWPKGTSVPLKDIRVKKSLLLQAVEIPTSQGTLTFLVADGEGLSEVGVKLFSPRGFFSCGDVPSLRIGDTAWTREGTLSGCQELFGRAVLAASFPEGGWVKGTWELLWLFPSVEPESLAASFRGRMDVEVWTSRTGDLLWAASREAAAGPSTRASVLLWVASALAVGNGALIGYIARRRRYGALAAAGVAGDELGALVVGDALMAVAAGSAVTLLLAGVLFYGFALQLFPEVCYSIPLTFLAALLGVIRPYQAVGKEDVLNLLYEDQGL